MTTHSIVMPWKSNEAREQGQKASENVRRSFMFHYPFLGYYSMPSGELSSFACRESPRFAAKCREMPRDG
jgi:hypothetical protein